MLRTFDLPERTLCQPPYTLHVWGPGIAKRKGGDSRFPTMILRGSPTDTHFLLLEAVDVKGKSFFTYAEMNRTARVYTRAALRCYFDDRCRCFGGDVFCDSVPAAAVIPHALKETSQCR